MKVRNVTFILMLGVLTLFSMCKKDKIDSPPNTGGNGGNGGNGSNSNDLRFVSFSPESGTIGDTVNLNFAGYANDISVSFGNTEATVLNFSTTTNNNVKSTVIRVLVPDMPDTTTKIKVKVDTVVFTSEKSFTRTKIPQFSGFSPANGFIGDTITITGTFYERYTPDVRFGNIRASIISHDSKTMKVIVPNEIDNATPAITVVDGQTMTNNTTLFHLKAPVIDSITPKTAYLGQVVRIIGKGFRGPYSSTYNTVYMDNSLVYTNAESNTSIPVYTKNAGLGMHGFAVEVAGLKTLAKDSVKLIADVAPVITSIEDTIFSGNYIEIMGSHFLSPSPEVPTTVTTVDGGITRNFKILNISDNEIIVKVPGLSNSGGEYNITVTVLSSSVTYNKPVVYYNMP